MSGSNEFQAHVYTQTGGGGTASESVFVNETEATVSLTGATVTFDSAVTANNTNNFAIALVNTGVAGAGTTAMTSTYTFNRVTGNLAALTPQALTVSTTAANLLVTAGQVVTIKKTENGTGLTMPNGKIALQFQYV
jgi:hypothetical protein